MREALNRSETSGGQAVTAAPELIEDSAVSGGASESGSIETMVAALELLDDDDSFREQCEGLQRLHGDHLLLWCARIRRLIRQKHFEEARELIAARRFDEYDDAGRLAEAEFLYDAHGQQEAGELFSQLIALYPERRDISLSYAKRLFADGFVVRANELAAPVRDTFAEGTKSRTLCDKAASILGLLTKLEGVPISADEDARILAMKHAILHFRDRIPRARSAEGLGRLTLVTGSLGPGGAERQLTRVAIEFERARKRSGEIAGIALDQPVEVLVRSHGPERQNDFYLSDLQEAGVELRQINLFDPVSPKTLEIDDPDLLALLDYLPASVNYGVKRLAPYLRASGTDTISAWQDGACLFTGLAALVAGVPQIQLAIRGLPPSMRRHMFRPEYEVLYRAMAQIPGVSFISNNVSAARAYAEWLEIPLNRFAIVYNGVEKMDAAGSADCQRMWEDFLARTADATHTVGSVFRFDTDKQPLLWIRFAARYLKRQPDARFVMVGGGRLLPNAEQLAAELGISDRILFTGRSNRVGYWMTKMEVLVLLSRYEGLPNVLIEAQYMGVRVVTTPAGGAAECLMDGVTGHVLECAEKPDLDGIVERANDLAMKSSDHALFIEGGAGRAFLDSRFSIPHMLAQFVTCTKRGLGSDMPDDHVTVESKRAAA
jgi:glycosyltransferase involved in cell wall biosynthesis